MRDFETSIPIDILYYILLEMNLLNGKNKNEFLDSLGNESIPVLNKLEQKLGIDIEHHKVKLGKTLAQLLNKSGFYWWSDKGFMSQTELGKFLSFIQSINDNL